MKTRLGFVSNSSSSSFFLVLKEEDYNKTYEKLTNLEREILNYLSPEKTKRFGENLITIAGMSGNYDSFEDFSPDSELTDEERETYEDNGASCTYDEIEKKLRKHPHIYHSVDC